MAGANATGKTTLLDTVSLVSDIISRAFSFDIFIHPLHDAGCRTTGHEYLRPFEKLYKYCLMIFDFEGCGAEDRLPSEIVADLEEKLAKNGWDKRSKVIIIEPELENWIWVASPHLATETNWQSLEELENWLIESGLKRTNDDKPKRPKEAFEAALRKSKKRRSSAIYEDIAKKASFKKCNDSNFAIFLNQIKEWFGSTS